MDADLRKELRKDALHDYGAMLFMAAFIFLLTR